MNLRPLLPVLLTLAIPLRLSSAEPVDDRIRLNSVGFTPAAIKAATVAVPAAETFRVRRLVDGAVVLEGALGAVQQTAPGDTNETVRVADFSGLRAPGDYRIEIPDEGQSAVFRVQGDLWNTPFRLVARGLTLWRCGTEIRGQWRGVTHHHAACHLDDGWLDYVGGGHVQRDGTGGWHDAGDYNKYVVNAGVSVGLIIKAWEHFGDRLAGVELALPESGNGVPDLLNELRWELEWLLKMQAEDGRVYHKLSARDFAYWGPPEEDSSPRFFVPGGTTALADFVAMLAMAARTYAPYDAAFAATCLDAAQRAWAALAATPGYVAADQTGFSTGGYEADDAVHRLWAAAEFWRTTGDAAVLADFEQRAATQAFTALGPTWGDVRDLALATYLESDSAARDAVLVERLRASALAQADAVMATIDQHAYARGLGGGNWFWGANGSVAAQTFLLHLADRLQPDPAYRVAAEQTLGFLFGRNFHNRSYVTGLGHRPPEHPHDRRGEPAWPGYLVGGGWPTGRSWEDEQDDYEQNEIALNWNASLIYALAAFVEPTPPPAAHAWAAFPLGQTSTFQPAFSVTGATSYTATGLPHWAELDLANGSIRGRPTDNPATPVNDTRAPALVAVDAHRSGELIDSRLVTVLVPASGSGIRIVNLSARAHVGQGENMLIAGFVLSGQTENRILLRGIGPALRSFGVTTALEDAQLQLLSGDDRVMWNDDWGAAPNVAELTDVSAVAGAFELPGSSRDAVALVHLNPGAFTVQVQGVGGATGVGLAEIYDVSAATARDRLHNISARARVAGGDSVLISGVVLAGGGSGRILVRAIGPSLAQFGVATPLPDPVLRVHAGQSIIAANDDWETDAAAELAATAAAVGGFGLAAGGRDAAVIAPLVDGGYTITVEDKYGASGVALIELYLAP